MASQQPNDSSQYSLPGDSKVPPTLGETGIRLPSSSGLFSGLGKLSLDDGSSSHPLFNDRLERRISVTILCEYLKTTEEAARTLITRCLAVEDARWEVNIPLTRILKSRDFSKKNFDLLETRLREYESASKKFHEDALAVRMKEEGFDVLDKTLADIGIKHVVVANFEEETESEGKLKVTYSPFVPKSEDDNSSLDDHLHRVGDYYVYHVGEFLTENPDNLIDISRKLMTFLGEAQKVGGVTTPDFLLDLVLRQEAYDFLATASPGFKKAMMGDSVYARKQSTLEKNPALVFSHSSFERTFGQFAEPEVLAALAELKKPADRKIFDAIPLTGEAPVDHLLDLAAGLRRIKTAGVRQGDVVDLLTGVEDELKADLFDLLSEDPEIVKVYAKFRKHLPSAERFAEFALDYFTSSADEREVLKARLGAFEKNYQIANAAALIQVQPDNFSNGRTNNLNRFALEIVDGRELIRSLAQLEQEGNSPKVHLLEKIALAICEKEIALKPGELHRVVQLVVGSEQIALEKISLEQPTQKIISAVIALHAPKNECNEKALVLGAQVAQRESWFERRLTRISQWADGEELAAQVVAARESLGDELEPALREVLRTNRPAVIRGFCHDVERFHDNRTFGIVLSSKVLRKSYISQIEDSSFNTKFHELLLEEQGNVYTRLREILPDLSSHSSPSIDSLSPIDRVLTRAAAINAPAEMTQVDVEIPRAVYALKGIERVIVWGGVFKTPKRGRIAAEAEKVEVVFYDRESREKSANPQLTDTDAILWISQTCSHSDYYRVQADALKKGAAFIDLPHSSIRILGEYLRAIESEPE
ncbi:MAG: hypothetical protein KDD70_11450 [Bdellovibrionales bacterium]|nr:hypothetical protein [Bdellovibrionales bacterium]